MTIEDPIEYLHRDKMSIISQREIGVDTNSFSQALRSALRQDPDVILVGEMRDFETIETALLAAETGHLVFSTLHTLDATETINRIVAVFPPHQQQQIRIQLASVLKAVISQRLIPRADGKGRAPAVEVMITHRVHPGLHPRQGQDATDSERHRPGHVAVRDADLRPVDLPPVRAGHHHARKRRCAGRRTSTSSSSGCRASRPRPTRRGDEMASVGPDHDRRRPRLPDSPELTDGRWLRRATSLASGCSPAASCRRRRCAHDWRAGSSNPATIDAAVARLQARARPRRPPHGAGVRQNRSARQAPWPAARAAQLEALGIDRGLPGPRWPRCSARSTRTR